MEDAESLELEVSIFCLPSELIYHIISQLEVGDCHSLYLTCRRMSRFRTSAVLFLDRDKLRMGLTIWEKFLQFDYRIKWLKLRECSGLKTLLRSQSSDLTIELDDTSQHPTLRSLTSLNLNTEVRDLELLTSFCQLRCLVLRPLPFQSQMLEVPLSRLKKLESLKLISCICRDFKFISGCTRLTSLEVSGPRLWDVSGLESLTSLVELKIVVLGGIRRIQGTQELSSLTRLRRLEISGFSRTQLGVLESLTSIEELGLKRSIVGDLNLSVFKRLKKLSLRSSIFFGIENLLSLSQLEELDVREFRLYNPGTLWFTRLSNLRILKVDPY